MKAKYRKFYTYRDYRSGISRTEAVNRYADFAARAGLRQVHVWPASHRGYPKHVDSDVRIALKASHGIDLVAVDPEDWKR